MRRRSAVRDRILDAAWRLARRDGVAAVSLRNLAREVDLTQPALYSYFAAKNALYDAMFAQGCEQLLATVTERRYGPEPRQAVKQMVADLVRFCAADLARAQLLFERPVPTFEPTPESYQLAIRFFDVGSELLARAGASDPAHRDIFTALIGGLISQQISNEPGGDRWTRHADEVVDMFLDHVNRRKDSP